MQLHQLARTLHRRKSRRIARGGKRGGYSGRGIKGQRSRAGAKIRPAIRDIIKKIPKLRGRGEHSFVSFHEKAVVVNVGDLEKKFSSGAIVNPKELLRVGLVRPSAGKIPAIKVLGEGKVKKKLSLEGIDVSESAKAKIEHAGGAVG